MCRGRGPRCRGGFCRAHYRALALVATVSDALLDFFGIAPATKPNNGTVIRPGTQYDAAIIKAGQCLSEGLALLIGVVLGEDNGLPINPNPLYVGHGVGEATLISRWRIDFHPVWGEVSDPYRTIAAE